MPELTDRQERILSLIIREYTNKPEPVSSKFLAETYLANLSSATIRNEMARLEELGLLAAPHTSAGRVPTEAGYRYFVSRLLADELPAEEKSSIAAAFNTLSRDLESHLRVAAGMIARSARGAALIAPPRLINSQFKHLALISTQGRLVMMVLVLVGGGVRQQMLTLAEAPSQDELTMIANQINALCEGCAADELRAKAKSLETPLAHEILEIAADVLDESDSGPTRFLYREGLSELLVQFTESIGAQQAVRAVEEPSVLHEIISALPDDSVGQVQVIVAGDGRWQEVEHLGMVLSRYGVPDQATGALVLLGPLRMRYGRAVATVRYVAGLVSEFMLATYGESGEKSG